MYAVRNQSIELSVLWLNVMMLSVMVLAFALGDPIPGKFEKYFFLQKNTDEQKSDTSYLIGDMGGFSNKTSRA